MGFNKEEYLPVNKSEDSSRDSDDLLPRDSTSASSDEEYTYTGQKRPKWLSFRRPSVSRTQLWVTGVNFTVLLASVVLLVLAVQYHADPSLKACLKATTWYSPAWEAVEYEDVQFQGMLGVESVFKGPPRPELDAAWDSIHRIPATPVSAEVMDKVNKSSTLEYAVKYPDEIGGGYMASLEVFHQIHCLSLVRKWMYKDYYMDKERAFQDPPDVIISHLDHCIDMVRQRLMCAADTGLLTGVWLRNYPRVFADFNTAHKCVKFDKLLDWARENAHKIPFEYDLVKPEGAPEMEHPPS